jgi:hypothetical protein
VQAAIRRQLGVLRNIAAFQGMPLLEELAAWQLGGGRGSGQGSGA